MQTQVRRQPIQKNGLNLSVGEVYDIVFSEVKRRGKVKEFLAEFGTRKQYLKRCGIMEVS